MNELCLLLRLSENHTKELILLCASVSKRIAWSLAYRCGCFVIMMSIQKVEFKINDHIRSNTMKRVCRRSPGCVDGERHHGRRPNLRFFDFPCPEKIVSDDSKIAFPTQKHRSVLFDAGIVEGTGVWDTLRCRDERKVASACCSTFKKRVVCRWSVTKWPKYFLIQ